MQLILGSSSPRRLELLTQIGIIPEAVRTADIDETVRKGEKPQAYCQRMAQEKALALLPKKGQIVLCADTIVATSRRIFGKPENRAEAAAYLRQLSGRRHNVFTCVIVTTPEKNWQRMVSSQVKFAQISEDALTAYLDSNEWQGKAGAYAIQGRAATFITWISGSYSNIVGLPLRETAMMLQNTGFITYNKKNI